MKALFILKVKVGAMPFRNLVSLETQNLVGFKNLRGFKGSNPELVE